MKLRNKKTGEIKDLETIVHEAFKVHEVETIKNIEANWEDYKPKGPLIKDEKIRKVVRAWAEINSIKKIGFYKVHLDQWEFEGQGPHNAVLTITFNYVLTIAEGGKRYTITELCGEEE